MKLKLVLCSLILFVGSPAALAQKKRFCPVPPPSPFKHNGRIVTSFDPASSGMRTTLEHPRALGKEPGAPLYLTASFVHQDPRRGARPTVEVAFVSAALVSRFRDRHDLVLLCDGRQWVPQSRARYRAAKDAQGRTLEATSVTLSYDDLQNVIHSRRVGARLGTAEFELTNNHLEALRELASLIAPPANRWRAEE